MSRSSAHFTSRYGLAALSIVLAVGARALLEPYLGPQFVYSPLLLAVLIAAWYSGSRPALAAVALGAFAAYYFLLPRLASSDPGFSGQIVGLILYFLTGSGIAMLAGSRHTAQRALSEANETLERRVSERTAALEALGEKLRHSEAHFRSMVEGASNHAIYMLDLEGRVVHWNGVAERIKGYRAEEIIGRHFSCFYTPEDIVLDLPGKALAQALAEGRFSDEGYRVRKDGTRFWAEVTITPYFDGDGRTLGYIKVTQDITDRKANEDALREERDLFATIVSTVPVVICSFQRRPGGHWSFPFAGPAIRDIYGFDAGELVEDASGVYERIHPDDRACFLESLRTSGSTMRPWRAEYRVLHPQRGKIWVEAHAMPCSEPDGAVLWHGYLADIAERKQAENALAERERMLQFVTSSVRAGLVVMGPDYQYLFANEAYGQIYGLDPEQIVGKTIPEVLPFAWSQIKPHLDEALSGLPGQFEIVLPPLPGTQQERTFFAVYEPRLREDGTPTSVVVVSDITGRKRVEAALVDRERLLGVVTGTIRVGLVVVGPDYRYQFANEAYADIFNLGPADLVGRQVPEILPRDWSQIQPRLDRALAGERVAYELSLPAPGDGSLRYFSVNYEPRLEASGIRTVVVVVMDVSESKRAEEKAARMSERIQLATRAARLGIWDLDLVENRLAWDDQMFALYGVSRENFPGAYDAWLAGVHPDDRERCDRESQQARAGISEYDSEFRVVWPEGTVRVLKAIGEVFRDDTGKPVRMLGINFDITERKNAEAEALEREERFRQIAEHIREVFWLIDSVQGRVLYVSPAYETIWGRSCESLYENPGDWLDAIHPYDRERVRETFARQQQGRGYGVEYRVVRPDESIRWIHDRGFPIYNEEGMVYRIAGVAEDITERRQAEAASQQQQLRLEGIVDSAMDGIITVGEDQRVILINAAAERMFGWLARDVIGERVERFIPERFREGHEANVLNFGRTGIAARAMGRFGTISGLRANGEEFPLEASISQIVVEGKALYTVTCRDVTERVRAAETQKRLETQLHQSQKMEAFGQLAGGVAHDFNNLLTIITGYSEWMLASLSLEVDLRNMIGEIHRAAERAAALTRQLLAFSRQQVIEPKVLDLNAVVDGVGRMLRRLIGEDIQLATVLSPSIGLVRIDPGQIEQVIMNLAVNARDAMPHGGCLTIETGVVEFDGTYAGLHTEAHPGDFVMLAISDTGTGMPPEIRERIFEPFFTTKGMGKGTGLGLAVVHGIVKQSGGSIEVYSETDKGTTFKIYLPIVHDETGESEARVHHPLPRGAETILLVEDEVAVRMVTVLALQSLGYTVLEAQGGEAAIQMMTEHPGEVDLLLSDVVMPEMSGRTLAETLAAQHPELKVLFVSGYTDDAIVRHGVLQAEVAFLQKPFTMGALARKLREVLEGE